MTLTGMHYYETSGKVKFWGGLSKRQTHTILTMEQIMKTNGHGTVELRTERMILRRYHPEDAPELYKEFGTDTEMYRYSGWNPYATPEMAQDTVRGILDLWDSLSPTGDNYTLVRKLPKRSVVPQRSVVPRQHSIC